MRVITPGLSAGELLHVLSSLERRSTRWDQDPESARAALSAAVSLLLRLLGRDPDPAKSREHVLLSVLAARRLAAGEGADLPALLQDLAEPPIEQIGALALDEFLPRSERKQLAAALNTLLASPTFASWRQGATLDVGDWFAPKEGKTPAVVVSVAHLDEDERRLVLGIVLDQMLAWVRSQSGTHHLRALLVFDEVYGFLPPHPQNPPTKRPLVALMKQARAFGVGVVVATQPQGGLGQLVDVEPGVVGPPVDPRDLVVLDVGVVVAPLRTAALVACRDHRRPARQAQRDHHVRRRLAASANDG